MTETRAVAVRSQGVGQSLDCTGVQGNFLREKKTFYIMIVVVPLTKLIELHT